MNYRIIQNRKKWLVISTVAFIAMASALILYGLKLGIDFTGGSLMEIDFKVDRPRTEVIYDNLKNLDLGSLTVFPVGDTGMIIRFQDSTEEKHQAALNSLKETLGAENKDKMEETRFESVGPSIGQELRQKAYTAIFLVLVGIVIYISLAFRKVSKPVASWKYGISALIAMVHDTIITLGFFAIMGKFFSYEINTAFVAAILTVVGYSVHDTIVVFDRIRENLPRSNEDFEGTVNTSLNQTLWRSINTSLTTLLTLTAIIIFGGASIRPFALALAVGIFFGTYSSIFLASPLLVSWEKFNSK